MELLLELQMSRIAQIKTKVKKSTLHSLFEFIMKDIEKDYQ